MTSGRCPHVFEDGLRCLFPGDHEGLHLPEAPRPAPSPPPVIETHKPQPLLPQISEALQAEEEVVDAELVDSGDAGDGKWKDLGGPSPVEIATANKSAAANAIQARDAEIAALKREVVRLRREVSQKKLK